MFKLVQNSFNLTTNYACHGLDLTTYQSCLVDPLGLHSHAKISVTIPDKGSGLQRGIAQIRPRDLQIRQASQPLGP